MPVYLLKNRCCCLRHLHQSTLLRKVKRKNNKIGPCSETFRNTMGLLNLTWCRNFTHRLGYMSGVIKTNFLMSPSTPRKILQYCNFAHKHISNKIKPLQIIVRRSNDNPNIKHEGLQNTYLASLTNSTITYLLFQRKHYAQLARIWHSCSYFLLPIFCRFMKINSNLI